MGVFPEIRRTFLGGPYNKDFSILGYLNFGNLPYFRSHWLVHSDQLIASILCGSATKSQSVSLDRLGE